MKTGAQGLMYLLLSVSHKDVFCNVVQRYLFEGLWGVFSHDFCTKR